MLREDSASRGLDFDSNCVRIADIDAKRSERPVPAQVRDFYSERSDLQRIGPIARDAADL
jgi:hypothetical protein